MPIADGDDRVPPCPGRPLQHARPRRACPLPGRCWPERGRCATTRTGARVTFSPKVFIPLTMLCRDRCGYCTFAQPPARLESPYLTPDQVLAHRPRRAPRPAATRRCSPSASGPEERYPVARAWLDEHGYALDRRLPRGDGPARARRDRPAPPRQRRRPRPRRAGRAAAGRAAPGDDGRVAQRRPRLPPRLAGQGARAAPGHPRGGRRARHPLHHRHPRRHRRGRRRPHRRPSRRSPPPTDATATCRR